MADFNSKYSGEQVEQLLDQVASGNAGGGGGGGITVETDPVFSTSPAASITEEKIAKWDNKMDKVTLATVATSGNYSDLSNKPTIPTKTSELENDSGFLAKSLTGYLMSTLQLTGDLRNNIGDTLKWSSTSKQLKVSDVGGYTIIRIDASGDGTKFLANDGKYKEVYTKGEIDTTIGDINTILESIISG